MSNFNPLEAIARAVAAIDIRDSMRNAKMPDNDTCPESHAELIARGVASCIAIAANIANDKRAKKAGEPTPVREYTSGDTATLFAFARFIEAHFHDHPVGADGEPIEGAGANANAKAEDGNTQLRELLSMLDRLAEAGLAHVEVVKVQAGDDDDDDKRPPLH